MKIEVTTYPSPSGHHALIETTLYKAIVHPKNEDKTRDDYQGICDTKP